MDALLNAIWQGDLQEAKRLVGQGEGDVNVDSVYRPPLLAAIIAGNLPIVQWLLEQGADANSSNPIGGAPLSSACSSIASKASTSDRLAMARLLIANGADVNRGGGTALDIACLDDCLPMVQLLLDSGADVNLADESGCMPIHRVNCRSGTTSVAELLIDWGVDVNATDACGNSVLIAVVGSWRADAKLVMLLVQRGAALNVSNDGGDLPLHAACQMGDSGIVQILLDEMPSLIY